MLIAALLALAVGAPPDLTVSDGSVTAGHRLTGTFVVRNAGARAPASRAKLMVGARVVRRYRLPPLRPGAARAVSVDLAVPAGQRAGTFALRGCAGRSCRRIGTLVALGGPVTAPAFQPIAYQPGRPFALFSARSPYYVAVPEGYDARHRTPMPLLVWLHGCGGQTAADIERVAGATYIAIAVGGREETCWDPRRDVATVKAAIADVRTHFNVDRRRVVVGGYSSGGDLAYRTAFFNSTRFAGVLALNTAPFRYSRTRPRDGIAAAVSRFHVVHVAQTGDAIYPIAAVREETDALQAAGFPVERLERPGAHGDADTGTHLQTLLLPRVDDGWRSG